MKYAKMVGEKKIELTVLLKLESVLPSTESGPGFSSTSPQSTIRQKNQVEKTVTVRVNRRLRLNNKLLVGVCVT